MRAVHWISFAVLAVAIAAFARYLLERQESAALRAEIALLEHENRQVATLRAEHEQLLATKVSDAELERLRNDRAALGRLRGEIRKLEETAARKTRAAQQSADEPLPALVLNLGIAGDGGLLLDGVPASQNAFRQLLTTFAKKSERVDIRFRVGPTETRLELIKTAIDEIAKLGRELGLRMTLRLDRTAQ